MNILPPIVYPAIIAGLCWLISWRLWNRRNLAKNGYWGGALGAALGYAAARLAHSSTPPWPPITAEEKLFYLALAAGLVCAAEFAWRKWLPIRLMAWLAIPATFVWLQSTSIIEHRWSTPSAFLWIAGFTIVAAILIALLDHLAERQPGGLLPLSLWLTISAASVSLVLTGSALLAQLAGSLAAILGAAVVLGFWAPTLKLSRGAATILVPIFLSLLWQGHWYSELPLPAMLCFPIALAAPALASISTGKRGYAAAIAVTVQFAILIVALSQAYGVFKLAGATEYDY